jgi:hypothetical protein
MLQKSVQAEYRFQIANVMQCVLQDMNFLQQYMGDFTQCGPWNCVCGLMVTDVTTERDAFILRCQGVQRVSP